MIRVITEEDVAGVFLKVGDVVARSKESTVLVPGMLAKAKVMSGSNVYVRVSAEVTEAWDVSLLKSYEYDVLKKNLDGQEFDAMLMSDSANINEYRKMVVRNKLAGTWEFKEKDVEPSRSEDVSSKGGGRLSRRKVEVEEVVESKYED